MGKNVRFFVRFYIFLKSFYKKFKYIKNFFDKKCPKT